MKRRKSRDFGEQRENPPIGVSVFSSQTRLPFLFKDLEDIQDSSSLDSSLPTSKKKNMIFRGNLKLGVWPGRIRTSIMEGERSRYCRQDIDPLEDLAFY